MKVLITSIFFLGISIISQDTMLLLVVIQVTETISLSLASWDVEPDLGNIW